MNEQNLKPRPLFTSGEEAQRMGHLGGSVISSNKKVAAQLREMRKKGLTKESERKLYGFMTDPDICDLQIQTWIEAMKSQATTVQERGIIAKLELELRRLRHGTQDKIQNNILISNQLSISAEDKFKSLLKDDSNRQIQSV